MRGVRCQVGGVRCQVGGVRCQAGGVRCQTDRVRCQAGNALIKYFRETARGIIQLEDFVGFQDLLTTAILE